MEYLSIDFLIGFGGGAILGALLACVITLLLDIDERRQERYWRLRADVSSQGNPTHERSG